MTLSTDRNQSSEASLEHARTIGAHLARLRDELVVKNHLAAMEAKDAAHELAGEVDKLAALLATRRRDLAAQALDAELALMAAMFDVNTRLLAMEDAFKAALGGAARSATTAAETARVKAALAAMDAGDAIQEAKRELHRFEERGARVVHDVDALLTRLGVRTSKVI